MQMNIDFSKVVPLIEMAGKNNQETESLKDFFDEAVEYLNAFDWHTGITDTYFGMGLGEIFAVFLFKVEPASQESDDYVWVMAGDIPPAYITCENAPNPATALDRYIGAMSLWAQAAQAGKSVDQLIPIDMPATIENGLDLQSRLEFLDQNVLSQYEGDLKKESTN
ncbi:MAG: hypothetical protein R8K49_08830 [Mariprofundaceae bacterium]